MSPFSGPWHFHSLLSFPNASCRGESGHIQRTGVGNASDFSVAAVDLYLRILTEVFTSSGTTQYVCIKCKVEWKYFEIHKVSESFLPVHPLPGVTRGSAIVTDRELRTKQMGTFQEGAWGGQN